MSVKRAVRFFFVVESLLLLLVVWQLIDNPLLLAAVLCGGFLVYRSARPGKKRRLNRRRHMLFVLGGFLILQCLLYDSAVWSVMVFTVLFIGLKGVEMAGVKLSNWFLKKNKLVDMVGTTEPNSRDGQKQKQPWFGNQRIG